MADLKICRICLRTECKVYKLDRFQLKSYYEEVMALKVNDNDVLPHYFCYECATTLHKFHKFKEKCHSGQKALREMLWRGPITYESVYKLDRNSRKLQSPLQIITLTDQVQTYTVIEPAIEPENQGELETENNKKPHSPATVFVDVKGEVIKLESKKIRDKRKGKDFELDTWKDSTQVRRTRFLDATNWNKVRLTEDEAVGQFRAKAEDPKYLKSKHKCKECFKGFSKSEMLNRHQALRHSESLGAFECRLCRARFRWESHRRAHLRSHFTRYRCLRCPFVCNLENSALLHEEYHSGTTRKCIHCGEEFRHASTYYTHLRTHRSRHVCARCGASFVSAAGLHQHRRVAHVQDDQESSDGDEDTHCARCAITFASRRALDEHRFHSALHAEGVEHELHDELTIPRKVLGKRLRAKITRDLRNRKPDDEQITAADTKRRKKPKRLRRIPTTCYQCGLQFPTQAACRRHHAAAHPRSPRHPPAARHVCELCGAVLAPGSVAVHQNMHSRRSLRACAECGRAFHSAVGLKRHLLTHTGEKPFPCAECGQRFTQSNSMKLHFRTKHLHQPYPRRNRRKKKQSQEPQEAVEPAPAREPALPHSPHEANLPPLPQLSTLPQLKPVAGAAPDISDDTVHYLTLN